MAFTSTRIGGEQENKGLDALGSAFAPFKLTGRFIKGGVESVDDILRGLGRAFGAVGSDVAEVVREPLGMAVESLGFDQEERGLGPRGWWTDDSGNRKISSYDDLLKPVGLSFANTLDTIGDLTYVYNLGTGGTEKASEHAGERLQQLNDDPFNFLLEHVGNAAIVGAAVAKPATLGISTSRGATTGAQAAKGLRPLAGREIRRTARQATREAAEEGSKVAKATVFTEDIIGHPYRSTVKAVGGSRAAQLIRNPRAFDPETRVGETTDNLGDIEAQALDELSALNDDSLFSSETTSAAQTLYETLTDPDVAFSAAKEGYSSLYRGLPSTVSSALQAWKRGGDKWAENADVNMQVLDDLVEASPEGQSPELWRGVSQTSKHPDPTIGPTTQSIDFDSLSPGDQINLGVTSWSSQATAARRFSDGPILRLKEGDKAVPIPGESEWLSKGRFTVDSIEPENIQGEKIITLQRSPRTSGDSTFAQEARGGATAQSLELPPVPEGHVRMYRGDTPGDFEAAASGLPPEAQALRGRWFTPDMDAALEYAQGNPSNVRYVDVPNDRLAEFDMGGFNQMDEFVLSEELAGQATSVRPKTGADVMAEANRLDAERTAARSAEEGRPTGTSTDPQHQLGSVERIAQGVGYALEDIRKSNGYQAIFGSDARGARKIRDQLREGLLTGTGKVAEGVRARFFDKDTAVGNVNVRRKWDPSRVERLLLRDIANLGKRADAERWTGLLNDIEIDKVTLESVPGRVKDVALGGRVVGQTLSPEGLLTRISRVVDEAKRQAGGADNMDTILREMLPGVDPMGLYLLGLNAVEKARGLPENSLTSALADYVSMDRFADVNRQAQGLLRDTDFDLPSSSSSRFRLPDEALDIDLNALPDDAQALFEGAAEQYRRDLATGREPMLVEEGVIPSAGTRIGRAADEPTQFPTELQDMPLTKEWSSRLRAAEKNVDLQRRIVDDVAERLNELGGSGRALYKPYKNQRGVYQTQTGAAVKRLTTRLTKEKARLDKATAKLDELEAQALVDPSNAPVSARNLLTYATRVAPEQAKALRAMADEGVGDPAVIRTVADELDAIPRTLEDLNSADVYLAYLKDIKDTQVVGEVGPIAGSGRPLTTRQPGGTRRRGTEVDIDYSRDFRARAYWQDSEFQSWFLARQADEMVKSQGLAKTGATRLKEAGWTSEQISDLTPGQAQQALERLGLRVYQPDQLFPSGRKPSSGNALEAEWITPFAEQNLMGAIDSPGMLERVLAEGIYDPIIQQWKVFALPLRLGWQVNNLAGSALLTTLVGQVNPFQYGSLMRASWNAVHDWNRGITSQVKIPLTDTYRAHLVAALQKVDEGQAAAIQNMLDENAIILSNEVLNDISSSGLTRGDFAWLNNSQFLRDIGAKANRNIFEQFDIEIPEVPGRLAERGRNIRQTGREVVDMAYHLNETVDNLHRTIVYIDQIGKGATHADAMTQVVKALGDYKKLGAFERRIVKRIYPFYPWMRHISEVVASSLKPDNLTRTLIFTHMTSIFGEPNEWEEMLPEWASGHVYMGMDENGTPKFLSTRGLNPFLDVFDPAAQPRGRGLLRPTNPFIQFGYEQMSGTSVLTGKPFSTPGQAFGSNESVAPPVGEYFFRNIPQAGTLRDIYRDLQGQPLTRYGTGEAAFFEGAEEGRSALQDVQQLFGYNVRPMDVEEMREKELLQDYRAAEAEARYQEQLEQQGGREARDLLNALPGLGG